MSAQSLNDDLILIACASRPGEMPKLLEQLLGKSPVPREMVADEARRVIGLLRLQAKSMEQMPPVNLDDNEAARLGLGQWVESTRARAAELRQEADEFERTAVAAGLLEKEDPQAKSARGLLRGIDVSEADIQAAKHALFRVPHDDN